MSQVHLLDAGRLQRALNLIQRVSDDLRLVASRPNKHDDMQTTLVLSQAHVHLARSVDPIKVAIQQLNDRHSQTTESDQKGAL